MTATASLEPAENLPDGAARLLAEELGSNIISEEKGEISLYFTNKPLEAKALLSISRKHQGHLKATASGRFILLSCAFLRPGKPVFSGRY